MSYLFLCGGEDNFRRSIMQDVGVDFIGLNYHVVANKSDEWKADLLNDLKYFSKALFIMALPKRSKGTFIFDNVVIDLLEFSKTTKLSIRFDEDVNQYNFNEKILQKVQEQASYLDKIYYPCYSAYNIPDKKVISIGAKNSVNIRNYQYISKKIWHLSGIRTSRQVLYYHPFSLDSLVWFTGLYLGHTYLYRNGNIHSYRRKHGAILQSGIVDLVPELGLDKAVILSSLNHKDLSEEQRYQILKINLWAWKQYADYLHWRDEDE